MKKIVIRDVLSLVSYDSVDKGGTPYFEHWALKIKKNRRAQNECRQIWIEFIPSLPNYNMLDIVFVNFFRFGEVAGLLTKEFWAKLSKFIKTEWTEEKYPSWHAITARGQLILKISDEEPKLLSSFMWVERSSRILKLLSPWVLYSIESKFNPEKALKRINSILNPDTSVHSQMLLMILPGMLHEFGKKRTGVEIEKWKVFLSRNEIKKLEKWFEIFSREK